MLNAIFNELDFIDKNLDYLKVKTNEDDEIIDFKKANAGSHVKLAQKKLAVVRQKIQDLNKHTDDTIIVESVLQQMDLLENVFIAKNPDSSRQCITKIKQLLTTIEIKKDPFEVNYSKIPETIREEIRLDIDELKANFRIGNYRSSIILCGRILETGLHRLYYEKTGKDLLETSPGLGIGKIMAKLNEIGISIPLGLNEQMHLINNARIASVHKQKEVFRPTKDQTHAIILYCIDVLKKLF